MKRLMKLKEYFPLYVYPLKFIQDSLIDDCSYSNSQTELSLNQSTIEASFPYKNYFCFGCNRIYEGHEEY